MTTTKPDIDFDKLLAIEKKLRQEIIVVEVELEVSYWFQLCSWVVMDW
jgi:hypothetical protein